MPSGQAFPTMWRWLAAVLAWLPAVAAASPVPPESLKVLKARCLECHDASSQKGGFYLEALMSSGVSADPSKAREFRRWIRVLDAARHGEMPPKSRDRLTEAEKNGLTRSLNASLMEAERAAMAGKGRTSLRRLTRIEYENTLRDLFGMPGIPLLAMLPPDGTAGGFDRNSEALSISHVNLAKYLETADFTLDLAIATRPEAPKSRTTRTSLLNRGGQAPYLSMQGDCVLLREGKPDPSYPAAWKWLDESGRGPARATCVNHPAPMRLRDHHEREVRLGRMRSLPFIWARAGRVSSVHRRRREAACRQSGRRPWPRP
jgi:mono/diheme cytochrome c family protein